MTLLSEKTWGLDKAGFSLVQHFRTRLNSIQPFSNRHRHINHIELVNIHYIYICVYIYIYKYIYIYIYSIHIYYLLVVEPPAIHCWWKITSHENFGALTRALESSCSALDNLSAAINWDANSTDLSWENPPFMVNDG